MGTVRKTMHYGKIAEMEDICFFVGESLKKDFINFPTGFVVIAKLNTEFAFSRNFGKISVGGTHEYLDPQELDQITGNAMEIISVS